MTWDFVDFEKGTISFVARKTNKETTIPLHAQLKDALLDSAGQDDPNAPIMPTLFGKSPWSLVNPRLPAPKFTA